MNLGNRILSSNANISSIERKDRKVEGSTLEFMILFLIFLVLICYSFGPSNLLVKENRE